MMVQAGQWYDPKTHAAVPEQAVLRQTGKFSTQDCKRQQVSEEGVDEEC